MPDNTPRTTFKLLMNETRDYLRGRIRLAREKISKAIIPLNDLQNIKSTAFVQLRPGSGLVDDKWTDSAGRLVTVVNRELIVQPYLQLSTDDLTAQEALVDSFLDLEDAVIDALQIYQPVTALEPFHFLGVIGEQGLQTPGWATTSLRFSVKFCQSVDQKFQ